MKNKFLLQIINNKVYIFILILFCLLITSCNNLPPDLQSKKDACNAKYKELADKEENASESSDYKQLITDYTNFKNEVISYTSECNQRGISKENDKLINKIDEKLSKFEKLSESDNSYSSDSSYSNSSSYSSSNTCSWCGKSFSGSHYTHLGKMSDCYSTTSSSSIGIYCSMKCCSEARRSSCPTCR
ncbi:hypothetical protein [Flavobacterium sp. GP15]|uniref:hypothetical protein n=1 Tax=Flavobacterium sp. GP15 TaxID=2758567 RepID=UPI00165DA1A1|nr:hypothetical protein [Flavobacterium sp. GP15]